MQYEILKKVQEQEMNEFIKKYCIVAFNNEQLKEGLEKHQVSTNELVHIVSGVFVIEKHAEAYINLVKAHKNEVLYFLNSDYLLKEDDKNLKDAIRYEMKNYEYYINMDAIQVLDALHLTQEYLEAEEKINKGYKEHIYKVFKEVESEYLNAH